MHYIEDLIYQKINTNIPNHYLDVSGDGKHFDVIVVSDQFANVDLLSRHRMIYVTLKEEMRDLVHALSIKAYTIAEWQAHEA